MEWIPWFGGLITDERENLRMPSGSALRAPAPCPVWTVGPWPASEIRTAAARQRRVVIFGPCSATEHELCLLAEGRVGDAVLLAFAGSYTVVQSAPDRTTVWTDVGHAWPIYTAKTRWGTVWGSSALALAALTDAHPDSSWLAATLLAPHTPELTAGRSAFAGVSVVPPASRLVLRRGAPPRVLCGWRPETAGVELAQGAVRVRRALRDAVATRIAPIHRPSADCSGGLDSTSLTLLAADQLPDGRRLHAVTVHPEGTTTGGDLDYARAALRTSCNVTHLLCPLAGRHAPFSRMQELMPPTDEPAPTTIAVARAVAEFEVLREVGSDCHLTGDGGDTVLGSHPAYLSDLARSGQIRLLMRHAIGWARLRRIPVWPVLAEALRTAATSRRLSSPAAWATRHACEIAAETACLAARRDCAHGDLGLGVALTLQAIQTVGRTARADAQVGTHYGVRLHNPFTDPQVIAACLSVPTWQRHTPYRYKPLLTALWATSSHRKSRPGAPRATSHPTTTSVCGRTLQCCTTWPTGTSPRSIWSTCSQHVRSADVGSAIVIVDARTGRVETPITSLVGCSPTGC